MANDTMEDSGDSIVPRSVSLPMNQIVEIEMEAKQEMRTFSNMLSFIIRERKEMKQMRSIYMQVIAERQSLLTAARQVESGGVRFFGSKSEGQENQEKQGD